jgi:hypothetical protein
MVLLPDESSTHHGLSDAIRWLVRDIQLLSRVGKVSLLSTTVGEHWILYLITTELEGLP